MSSILLSNPFTAPAPPSAALVSDAAALAALQPLQSSNASTNTSDSTGFSGSGGGSSNQSQTVALMQAKDGTKWSRPTNATSGSVIGAQSGQATEPTPLGSNLPEVEMPDPLPTSPFLKRNDDAA
jgi:hypothetical protein